MKFLKLAWDSLKYVLFYIGLQLAASFAFGVVLSARALSEALSAGIGLNDTEALNEYSLAYINENFDTQLFLIIVGVVTFLFITIFLWKEWKKRSFFGFDRLMRSPLWLISLLAVFMYFFTVFGSSLLQLDKLFPQDQEIVANLISSRPFLDFLTLVIIAPVVEEILLRALFLDRCLRVLRPPLAIFLSALAFGIMHFNITQFIYTFILGILLGLVYYWFDSIWASICLHAAFNGSSFAMVMLLSDVESGVEEAAESDNIFVIIFFVIALSLAAVCVAFLRKKRKEFTAYPPEADDKLLVDLLETSVQNSGADE